MLRLQKIKNSLRGLLMMQCLCLTLLSSAQPIDHLLSPSFFDKFSSAQVVSDSIIRIFGLSYQRGELIGGAAFFADYTITGNQLNISNQNIAGNQCSFNYGITQLPVLPLLDGGNIVGFNPFDCDYSPPGGLIKLNREGSPEWILSFRELDLYYPIDHMMFVDSNVIAVIGTSVEDTLYINRSGKLLSHLSPGLRYGITIETPFGFLASFQDRLDVLNSGFELMASYAIGEISDIQRLGNDNYLIKTDNKYYSYTQEGLLFVWAISPWEFGCVWASPTYLWGYSNGLNEVIQFDTLFEPLDTFSVARGFQLLFGIASDTILFVAGQYANELNKGIATIRYPESDPHFHFPRDLGVTSVDVADTILVDYVNEPFWGGGWYEHYDYINVEVTNFGIDTVDAYWIESETTSECGFCYYQNPAWWIDTMPIPPGEKVWIALGAYIQSCTWETPVSICLTTYAPDHKADDDYENDSACDTYSYIVGAEEAREPLRMTILPNPADHLVIIQLDPDQAHLPLASIFNAIGQKMEWITFTDYSTAIDVSDWPGGIYFLAYLDGDGRRGLVRFLVVH